jgi:hypothetical protein
MLASCENIRGSTAPVSSQRHNKQTSDSLLVVFHRLDSGTAQSADAGRSAITATGSFTGVSREGDRPQQRLAPKSNSRSSTAGPLCSPSCSCSLVTQARALPTRSMVRNCSSEST